MYLSLNNKIGFELFVAGITTHFAVLPMKFVKLNNYFHNEN